MFLRQTERKSKNDLETDREKENARMVLRKTERKSKNVLEEDREKEQEWS